jgi:hypothetical protein
MKRYKSGIVQVVFNTREKWCEYSINVNAESIVSLTEYGEMFNLEYYSTQLDIDFLNYVRVVDQEKDQVYVYFIPKALLQE